MSRAPSSRAQAGTTEARWVQWLLIGLALAFLLLFLLLPLAAVFAEALRQGWGAYLAGLQEPDAWAAIKLTLITALIAVPLISEKRLLGVLQVDSDQPAAFSEDFVDIYGYRLPRPLHFAAQGEGSVGVRPEAITLSDRGEESQRCTIRHVAYMGPQYEVTVEWHGQEILLQVNATRLQPDVTGLGWLLLGDLGA